MGAGGMHSRTASVSQETDKGEEPAGTCRIQQKAGRSRPGGVSLDRKGHATHPGPGLLYLLLLLAHCPGHLISLPLLGLLPLKVAAHLNSQT